jgi:hypothetical protein
MKILIFIPCYNELYPIQKVLDKVIATHAQR